MISKTISLVKFKKLQRYLGFTKRRDVVGLLESLWLFTQREAPAGDIGKFDDETIAIELEWDEEPSALVDALATAGFVDRSETHRLVVHDWHDHAPRYIHALIKKQGKCFASAGPSVDPLGEAATEGSVVAPAEATDLDQTRPRPDLDQAKSNQVNDQTKPRQAIPLLSSSVVALENVDRAEVIRQANKLIRACPSLGRELVWQIAWVGTSLDQAFVGDLISRIKAGVRSPRNYAKGAIRKACEERGVDWHSAVNCVSEPPANSDSIAG